MKNKTWFFFFCWLFNNTIGNSQTYSPFPLSNASWCVSSGYTDGTNEYTYNHYYEYTGVTLLFNNILYYELKDTIKECIHPIWQPGGWGCFYGSNYSYLRQDTLLKKVFLFDINANTEKTALDFNLTIGDWLDTSKLYAPPFFDSLQIISIDSVSLNGLYHRRFNFQPINCTGFYASDTSLVEGIGMLCGLFAWPSCFEYFSVLNEFKQNGQTVYPAGSAGSCGFTGIEDLKSVSSFELLPNDNYNNYILMSPKNWLGYVKVFSIEGKLLNSISIEKPQTKIELSQYHRGIYLISLLDQQQIVRTFKVFVN